METFDKVTKGLECCRESQDCTQDNMPKCPYYEKETCLIELVDDALALIQQLQTENAEKDQRIRQLEAKNTELIEKVEQLQAERDAAVADIDEMVMQTGFIACDWCDHCDCGSDCHWSSSNPGFKWRGVQT